MKRFYLVLFLVLALTQVGFADSSYEIAKHFAPIIYQDVDIGGMNGLDDYITRYDFDGNINASDNWENLALLQEAVPAYVYYTVTETSTHWFILYALYHPRDWDDEFLINRVAYGPFISQHENDLEGILLVVRKGKEKYGLLETMCTMAHHRWFNYPVVSYIQTKEGYPNDIHSEGRPKFLGINPIILVQAEGHGIYADEVPVSETTRWDPSTDYLGVGIKLWDETGFPDGDGIIYHPASEPELALPIKKGDPNTENQIVGYQLIKLEELWEIRDNPSAFNREGAFAGFHDGYDDPDILVNNPNNVFTPENWGVSFISVCGDDDDWAILTEECGSGLEIIGNTFAVEDAIVLAISSNPKIYSNLFTEKCQTAIWGRDNDCWPTIGGSTSRANSFLGSAVHFYGSVRSARYNWWGTADPEELKWQISDNVDYRYYLKSPPENAGANIPENELGDFDGDKAIDIADFFLFASFFGVNSSSPNWNPCFDLNFDGQVGIDDFFIFAANFGAQERAKMATSLSINTAQPISQQPKLPILFIPYPNPANSQVQINFFIPKLEFIKLKVFNVAGQEVRELVSDAVVGEHRVVWDSRSNSGQSVASGIYFCRLSTSTAAQIQKIVIVH